MRVFVFLLLVVAARARVFSRCEMAQALQNAGMDGFGGISLANWVCLVNSESSYNTDAIDHDWNGSSDYGLFQINSQWWCEDGNTRSSNGCQISCYDLLSSDITASVECAKTVFRESSNGIGAWVGWRAHCEGQDVYQYVAGCGV